MNGEKREKKKTILRTIRIDKDLDDALDKDANEHGVSENALISSILAKYVEWDRYAVRVLYQRESQFYFNPLEMNAPTPKILLLKLNPNCVRACAIAGDQVSSIQVLIEDPCKIYNII